MQTAGHFVSSAAKFTTCMQHGKYDFQRGFSCFMVHSDRNTTSVIFDRNGIVLIDGHIDIFTNTRQCLIYRIVYDLVHQMVQSSRRRTADVHTRSFTNCL